MRFHFIVNPVAGRGRALSVLDTVTEALRAQGVESTRFVTTQAGDARAHAAELAPDACDRLIVVGGDGTLREVVNGRDGPPPWPIGIMPFGTANLIGRELRMPLNPTSGRIAGRLKAAANWPVDVLRVRARDHEELAMGVVGAGLDAELVKAVSTLRAETSGGGYGRWLRPLWDVFRTFRFPKLRVTVDGRKTYAASACTVQNAHNYGGLFVLSPDAALDSGMLDVFLIRRGTHRDLFRIMAGAFLRRAHKHSDVKIVRGTHVRICADRPVPVQADGDPAGETDIEVELLPKAATLLRA